MDKEIVNKNYCPVCGKKPIVTARSFHRHSTCEEGHKWHTCLKHQTLALGWIEVNMPDFSQCTCPKVNEFAEIHE
jgi:formate dehydrogenase maturation protein FdhE